MIRHRRSELHSHPSPLLSRLSLGALLVAALTLLVPALATADTEPQARFQDRTDVEEVLLDVVVTDRKGNVVLGLDKDDFIVEEDGERQEIESVTFYSHREYLDSREAAEELGLDPEAVPTNRYFILFFHDQRSLLPRLATQQLEAGREAKQWVRSDLGPNDYVAVASFQYKLGLQLDFSNDPDAIASAIDDAVRGKSRAEALLDESVTHPEPSMLSALPNDPKQLRDWTPRIYDALEVVAQATDHIPARKNLVLFSLGFGEVDSFGFYQPDVRYYPDMREHLNDANVAVYPVDLIPSSALSRTRWEFALDSSLSNLAVDTGGEYYSNFVNFGVPLEQIDRDNSGYYLISYASDNRGEGYQEVDVETKQSNLDTRARRGYLHGQSEQNAALQR